MSPASSWPVSWSRVGCTTPAGTMIHSARGLSSLLTKSFSEDEPTAPSPSSALTASGLTSYTTHWCPSRTRRRTRLAPIRPSPIMPSCIGLSVAMVNLLCVASYRKSRLPGLRTHALERTVSADQSVGRRVVGQLRIGWALQLGDDLLGQDLAQFHPPLVKRVDVPDRALYEDAVLVEGDQGTEQAGSQHLGQQDVGRAIALHHAVGDDVVGGALRPNLICGLAERQRLGLGEHVGGEDVVVVSQRVQALAEPGQVDGGEVGSVVDELVEAVLPVGARLPPVDRAGLVIDGVPFQVDVLAVGLHGQLLQVCGKPFEVLLIGQDRGCLSPEEVPVPDRQQTHQDGEVLVKRRGPEVLIHFVKARQQLTA